SAGASFVGASRCVASTCAAVKPHWTTARPRAQVPPPAAEGGQSSPPLYARELPSPWCPRRKRKHHNGPGRPVTFWRKGNARKPHPCSKTGYGVPALVPGKAVWGCSGAKWYSPRLSFLAPLGGQEDVNRKTSRGSRYQPVRRVSWSMP